MFAEQLSVKLCCQLCCSVFKDPVITTCGVRLPVPALTYAPPRGWVGCQPSHVEPRPWSQAWSGCPAGDYGHAPTLPIVPTAYILSKMCLEVR